MDLTKIRSALKDLITRSKDAEKGYREISVASSSPFLREICLKLSKMRAELTNHLSMELRTLGGSPTEVSSSFLGELHRVWIDIKLSASNNQIDAVVDEIERGEKVSIEEYEKILNEVEMPTSTKVLLNNQLQFIKRRLDEMQKLRAEVDELQ